jgi:glycosyltransferase involved in cell wall biosynthesis
MLEECIPNPYISVAIPTYNRRQELTECLNSIVSQAKQHRIRIYISDNASNYDVADVVKDFQRDYPLIVLSRNSENLGLDANVRKSISLVESKYVWVFSDDDVMVEDALASILPHCEKGEFAWLIPNRELRNRDLTLAVNEQSWFDLTDNIYQDPIQLFSNYGHFHFTFVGSLIIKLEEWRKISPSKYMQCRFFEHTCILAEMMLQNKALALSKVLLYIRLGQNSYSDRAWMVWGHYLPFALSNFPDEYPLWVRRKVLFDMPELLYRPLPYMLIGRALGFVNRKTCSEIVLPFQKLGCKSWVLACYAVLLFPQRMIALVRVIALKLYNYYTR